MGLLSSLRPHRRGHLSGGGGQWQWSFLDVVWAVFLLAVVIFLALVSPRSAGIPCPPPPARCRRAPPRRWTYRVPVPWPESLYKIWHDDMPYGKIAERKGHQGWMKQEGSYFIFPGCGTMSPDGAEQYIEKLSQYVPLKSSLLRTGLDMGCGVIS